MTLAAGSRLGAYEIIGRLGAGGMGEVYRARDSRLKRDVALKVLPSDPEASATASGIADERRARFQREAELLAALNHPHIAQIYGVEDAGGQLALTMELVEGETLEDWIARGPRPYSEVRPVAIQIADALAYAHERGIIHRDLKPANIKISSDGAAKVLDFGLAKAVAATSGVNSVTEADPAAFMTLTSPAMTRVGTILGTAAYMAPEQARGVALDKRADIWAFGVVLFELLAGQRLFGGDTVSDTLAAVLKTEPDFNRLPPDTPTSIQRLLQRCLQKDRRRRLQDIGDARIELEESAHGDEPSPAHAPPRDAPRNRLLHAVALVAAGAAAALIATTIWSRTREIPAAATPYQFSITPADGIPIDDPPIFAVSPDGRTIAVRGSDNGVDYLYLRSLVDGSIRRLANSRGAGLTMAWSPDSRSLAFVRTGRLTILNVADTRPIELPFSDPVREGLGNLGSGGLAWTTNEEIAIGSRIGIVLASTTGGERIIFKPDRDLGGSRRLDSPNKVFAWPWTLPDGQLVVWGSGGEIHVLRRDGTGEPRRLEAGTQPQYVPPGWLLAVDRGRMLAWPFETRQNDIVGEASLVRDNVSQRMNMGRVFSASDTGILAVRSDAPVGSTRLAWFNRSGVETGSLRLEQHCRNPELSPAFDRVALECYEPSSTNRDVWLYDLSRDAAMRFTADQADDSDAVWSSDAKTIVFTSNREGSSSLLQKGAGGAVSESVLFEVRGLYTIDWSPDARHVALLGGGSTQILDLTTKEMALFGDSASTLIELQFAPDGRWVSYSSDESGRNEIYVQPWPASGDKWQISISGGTDARWRPDGKELYFLSPARELMVVTIEAVNGFKASGPSRLFHSSVAGPLGSGHRFPYAVDKDGSRFLMYVSNTKAPPPSITVIVNWPALLGRAPQR